MPFDLLARHAAQAAAEQAHDTDSAIVAEYQSMWGAENRVERISLDDIRAYRTPEGKPQPYRIQDDKVHRIAVSAKDVGQLQILTVRPIDDNEYKYEVLSGHHRLLGFKEAGLASALCEIKTVDDATAYKIVAESNTPNGEFLPSEQGTIYKAYMDLRGTAQEEQTAKEIAEKFSVSIRTIYRYISLLELIPELVEAVDQKIIPIGHFEKLITALTPHQQMGLSEYITIYAPSKISKKQIDKLCDYAGQTTDFTANEIYDLFHPEVESDSEENELTPEQIANSNQAFFDEVRTIYPERFGEASDEDIKDFILKMLIGCA